MYIESAIAQSDAEYVGDNVSPRRSCPSCQLGIGGLARGPVWQDILLEGLAPGTDLFVASAGDLDVSDRLKDRALGEYLAARGERVAACCISFCSQCVLLGR